MKKGLSIVLALSIVLTLGGCGKEAVKTSAKKATAKATSSTKKETTSKDEEVIKNVSDTPTVYTLQVKDDKGATQTIYLKENDPNVVEIKNVMTEFLSAFDNRDYNTIKGDAEYSFYTEKHLAELKASDDANKTVEWFKSNSLVTESKGLTSINLLVYADNFKLVNIDFVSRNFIKDSIPTCKFQKGHCYDYNNRISLVKNAKGEWKVDSLEHLAAELVQ